MPGGKRKIRQWLKTVHVPCIDLNHLEVLLAEIC